MKRVLSFVVVFVVVLVLVTGAEGGRVYAASGVTGVSLVPASLVPGATTTYTVTFTTTNALAQGDTITVDWTGDGVSSGTIQQLLPATATFLAGAPGCGGSVATVAGNTVITLSNYGVCSIGSVTPVQLTITNVRNPATTIAVAGGVQTSADTATVLDTTTQTWTGFSVTMTGAVSPGSGPLVTSVAASGGLVIANAYVSSLGLGATFTTTGGLFVTNSAASIACRDGNASCDVDGTANGVVSVYLKGNGTPGTATVTATSADTLSTATTTVTFTSTTGSIAVAASPGGIPADGFTASTITATVLNANGLPISSMVGVSFSTTLGTLSASASSQTAINGVASVTLTSRTPGQAIVSATSANLNGSVTVIVGGADATSLVTVNPPLTCLTGATCPVSVLVTNSAGTPVLDGAVVTLSVSAGSVVQVSASTTAGLAAFSIVAPATPQTVLVTATVTGGASGTVSLNVAAAPAGPTQQVVAQTSTGVYCFVYSGPTTQGASFSTFFAPGVTGVNVLQLPAGNYLSWFRAAANLATVASISQGSIICVSASVGSNVFS